MCTPQREHVCLCAPARAVLRRPELLCRHQFPTDETSPYGRGGGGSQRQPSPLQGFPAGLPDCEIRPSATSLPADTTVPRPVLPPAQLALCRRRPPRGGLLSHKDPRESALHEEEPFSLVKTGDFTRLREAKPKAGTEVRPPTGKHTGAARVQGERVQAHPIRVSPREATEPEPLREGAAGGHAEGGRRLNCAVTKLQTAPRGPPAPRNEQASGMTAAGLQDAVTFKTVTATSQGTFPSESVLHGVLLLPRLSAVTSGGPLPPLPGEATHWWRSAGSCGAKAWAPWRCSEGFARCPCPHTLTRRRGRSFHLHFFP